MLGSSASVADPNIVLNTIVAESFTQAAEKLENSNNFIKDCKAYTEKLLKAHYRVIFNYNGYGPEWEPEAERRGLLNNKNTADAVPEFFKSENIEVFVYEIGSDRAGEYPARKLYQDHSDRGFDDDRHGKGTDLSRRVRLYQRAVRIFELQKGTVRFPALHG